MMTYPSTKRVSSPINIEKENQHFVSLINPIYGGGLELQQG